MFSSLGWQEVIVLLIVALLIFGPDKLPGAVKQATDTLKGVRRQVTGARQTVQDELRDVIPADFDRTMLNPKAFVRKHLWEDDLSAELALDLDEPVARPAARPVQFDAETT